RRARTSPSRAGSRRGCPPGTPPTALRGRQRSRSRPQRSQRLSADASSQANEIVSAAGEPEGPDGAAEEARRPLVRVRPVRDELVDEPERIAQRQPLDDERKANPESDRPAAAVLDPLAHHP